MGRAMPCDGREQELAVVRTSFTERRKGSKELGLLGDLVIRWLGSDSPLLSGERVKDSIVPASERLYIPVDEGDLPTPGRPPGDRRPVPSPLLPRQPADWQDGVPGGHDLEMSQIDLWIYQEIFNELHPTSLLRRVRRYGGSAGTWRISATLYGKGQVVSIDVAKSEGRLESSACYVPAGVLGRSERRVKQVMALAPRRHDMVILGLRPLHGARPKRARCLRPHGHARFLSCRRGHQCARPSGAPQPSPRPHGRPSEFLTTSDEFEVDSGAGKVHVDRQPFGLSQAGQEHPWSSVIETPTVATVASRQRSLPYERDLDRAHTEMTRSNWPAVRIGQGPGLVDREERPTFDADEPIVPKGLDQVANVLISNTFVSSYSCSMGSSSAAPIQRRYQFSLAQKRQKRKLGLARAEDYTERSLQHAPFEPVVVVTKS